ncbi:MULTISPECIES: chemotaxis protein CheB [Corallococcus]|uniref:chemotaxis protein CheB n=1 Tax=Corallococcus TaxID=83461 RepID=UPI0011811DC1|nr:MULTISPECIES: chemotaxis protein CheB [Corallococcus]NBD12103.1 chemotaxis protein CheB [Corallococcus silvisoli]TSC21626.1 chemotaxis protein CheB [Corallococcus sp. Z5C101001]
MGGGTAVTGLAFRVLLVGRGLRALVRGLFDGESLVAVGPPEAEYAGAEGVVRRHFPDVLLVDLLSSEALGAIERVMAVRPTPILALHPGVLTGQQAFQALALGALDVMDRPMSPGPDFWAAVGRKLVMLAQVKGVRSPPASPRASRAQQAQEGPTAPFPLVALAASLGGPKAVAQVLRMIPRGFPAPIAYCQHISQGFTEGLAHWLSTETALRVVEATHDAWMEPGTVYIAPSGGHLLVKSDGRLELDSGPALRGFRPSCDMLLTSAGEAFGSRCIGVILTGMGRDGARGLKEIRERGGRTIAQDEATCVVYGMPREAVLLGAAQQVLPLDVIAPTLVQWVDAC